MTAIKRGAIVVVVLLVGLVGARVALAQFRPHLYAGSILQGDSPAPAPADLTLSDGRPFDLADYGGEVVIMYFGYTHCPDVCPTTLSDVNAALELMPESAADRVNFVMVSVDPARDTLDLLGDYVASFRPGFLGAGGPIEAIDRVAAQYGIYYAYGEGDIESGYAVDHTANLMGIDPDGSLRIVWSPEVTREQLAADLEALLDD